LGQQLFNFQFLAIWAILAIACAGEGACGPRLCKSGEADHAPSRAAAGADDTSGGKRIAGGLSRSDKN